ncbi:3-deoxy-manno-octulosonate cytidylyltransferase [Saccharospirillum sp. MSK14-1]|uniref:3-deoxy-manno-octulosonate cytidylyltransferase n=1 Tax=Saccharospirillum sp. MSK14-1 TaxID=1897632 RepID=UPI000D3ADB85|nr:3-deoxy-manno-octulosonate cytidylyltransferase [Saccharospirillum sp. MSK14-1]PTY36642.1 3-deoxy-manno-octulosonate cytidylyltransferase [Saccharospirillum sp. MSK14-1]
MTHLIMIPARFGSSRLPGKPLMDIAGKPMVVRVVEAARSAGFERCVVATDDQRICEAVVDAGYDAVMTRADHPSGTDRLQEAADQLGLEPDDIVVNLQGDEPLMPGENLRQVVALLEAAPEAAVATLYEPLPLAEANNPNAVKLVQDRAGRVLYFSRAPIPWDRDQQVTGQATPYKRHIGLYAYRKRALDAFVTWSESPLEQLEKLEQLRFMTEGHGIVAAQAVTHVPAGVDTQADLDAVRAVFTQKGDS